jgi:adenylate kinase family enzyme
MQVAIIGNSGSGKSTLAQQLASQHELAMLDLDTVAWVPGQVAVPRSPAEAVADVQAFCDAHEHWVVEGCYASLIKATLSYAPVLLFLEPGVAACQANCRSRPWEPHKYASKQEQDEKLAFLLEWVAAYYTRTGDLSLAAHRTLFDAYTGPKQQLTERPDPTFTLPPS